ncbi:hypothetical protein CVT24_008677 [Panaeolus cyanescens]|uniref:Uncharacterized protein n=1 Tax=Panaeolus cyanescens TaxID=181874 RepID=A0A409WRC8_9AGAR|nr:hypothetical protein CVT24_008677 [Panaeolus cyanescens]
MYSTSTQSSSCSPTRYQDHTDSYQLEHHHLRLPRYYQHHTTTSDVRCATNPTNTIPPPPTCDVLPTQYQHHHLRWTLILIIFTDMLPRPYQDDHLRCTTNSIPAPSTSDVPTAINTIPPPPTSDVLPTPPPPTYLTST